MSMPETGAIRVDDKDKGWLGPDNMITIDLETGNLKQNIETKLDLTQQAPAPPPLTPLTLRLAPPTHLLPSTHLPT